ncbi:MAG: hypothetical protein V4501_03720 [Pseudomonadota bacterium]
MESPNSNSPAETQFRNGFLGLLETLRFSIVLLHNELVKQIQINPEDEQEKSLGVLDALQFCSTLLPDITAGSLIILRFAQAVLQNVVDKQLKVNPGDGKTPAVLELVDGKNNFITRIEHLKHNVAFHPEIRLKEMMQMIDEFKTLKTDIINVLQTKVADQNRHNPQQFFSPARNLGLAQVLRKSIEQINQNRIEITGTTLQIHTATIPEEVNANRLSSGTMRAVKRV